MSNVKVTVIIPTFNRRDKLSKAIESVFSQETVPFELIVVDDGSEDGTGLMVKRNFPEARYFFQPNQGPAAARNRGIKQARGEWIAFLDSDDEWMPGKLKAQLEFFNQNPNFLICQTEEIWIRNGRRVNPMKKHQKYGGWIFEKCLPLCIVSPSAAMIHRRLFDEVGLFDESLPACEDYDLWLRIAAKSPVGLIERSYVIKYGGHSDQRSHQFEALDRYRIQSLAKLLTSNSLTSPQAEAAQAMLDRKSKIYLQGALKRGRHETLQTSENLY